MESTTDEREPAYSYSLLPTQLQAVEVVSAAALASEERSLVVGGPASGKTDIAAEIARRLALSGFAGIYQAPSVGDLVEQAAERFRKRNPDTIVVVLDCMTIADIERLEIAPGMVLFLGYSGFAPKTQRRRLEALLSRIRAAWAKGCRFCQYADESHVGQKARGAFMNMLQELRAAAGGCPVVELTATPRDVEGRTTVWVSLTELRGAGVVRMSPKVNLGVDTHALADTSISPDNIKAQCAIAQRQALEERWAELHPEREHIPLMNVVLRNGTDGDADLRHFLKMAGPRYSVENGSILVFRKGMNLHEELSRPSVKFFVYKQVASTGLSVPRIQVTLVYRNSSETVDIQTAGRGARSPEGHYWDVTDYDGDDHLDRSYIYVMKENERRKEMFDISDRSMREFFGYSGAGELNPEFVAAVNAAGFAGTRSSRTKQTPIDPGVLHNAISKTMERMDIGFLPYDSTRRGYVLTGELKDQTSSPTQGLTKQKAGGATWPDDAAFGREFARYVPDTYKQKARIAEAAVPKILATRPVQELARLIEAEESKEKLRLNLGIVLSETDGAQLNPNAETLGSILHAVLSRPEVLASISGTDEYDVVPQKFVLGTTPPRSKKTKSDEDEKKRLDSALAQGRAFPLSRYPHHAVTSNDDGGDEYLIFDSTEEALLLDELERLDTEGYVELVGFLKLGTSDGDFCVAYGDGPARRNFFLDVIVAYRLPGDERARVKFLECKDPIRTGNGSADIGHELEVGLKAAVCQQLRQNGTPAGLFRRGDSTFRESTTDETVYGFLLAEDAAQADMFHETPEGPVLTLEAHRWLVADLGAPSSESAEALSTRHEEDLLLMGII